ncbi:GAF and ANTAR domain-containing protein [Nakamurella deserti]|uniref:GAF and ANTAR domain-containing protein n=1 Tax=Nakamurella deserti TaxID=2164074 RepID=UPI000DBE290D|nr:GAF and ANTAR domain-containing protein [Nakamurella deserti]
MDGNAHIEGPGRDPDETTPDLVGDRAGDGPDAVDPAGDRSDSVDPAGDRADSIDPAGDDDGVDSADDGADDVDPVGDDDDLNLDASLAALSRLSTGRLTLEDLLVQVAEFAVRAIPGADGAGLTLLEPNREDIIVKSTEFVRQIDDIQYRLGEGPCISAAAEGLTMRSGSLGGDPRWPRFGPRAGRLGVHSVLSLPLLTPSGVVGAMNVYAHARNAFDVRAEQLGQLFAAPAAITVHNAQILAQTARLAEQLQAALTTRPMIDQAIGILRARGGIESPEAFARLRHLSQTEHVKLSVVAERIVEEAVRRARARATPPR